MYSILNNVRTDRQYQSTTGLGQKEFEELLKAYTKNKKKYEEEKETIGIRTARKYDKILSDDEKELFFLLFYFKTYPTLDILGLNFGMEGSGAKKNIKKLYPVLQYTLEQLEVLPSRVFKNPEEMKKAFSQLEEILIDATERETQRPKNQEEQRRRYSGKKKA